MLIMHSNGTSISENEVPELAEAKRRCEDHPDSCPECRHLNRFCPEGEALFDAYNTAIEEWVSREKKARVSTAPTTSDAVEEELLHILNRWQRRYPAYLLRPRCGDFAHDARVKRMHQDIGFLLQLVGKALKESSQQ
jgi:hypothetical protein